MGRGVSDFFLDFLQAKVGLDVKAQNHALMQAVADFCADHRLDKEETNQYRQRVFDHCSEQIKSGDEVHVSELSAELPPSMDGEDFLTMKGTPANLCDQLTRRGLETK